MSAALATPNGGIMVGTRRLYCVPVTEQDVIGLNAAVFRVQPGQSVAPRTPDRGSREGRQHRNFGHGSGPHTPVLATPQGPCRESIAARTIFRGGEGRWLAASTRPHRGGRRSGEWLAWRGRVLCEIVSGKIPVAWRAPRSLGYSPTNTAGDDFDRRPNRLRRRSSASERSPEARVPCDTANTPRSDTPVLRGASCALSSARFGKGERWSAYMPSD